MFQCRCSNVDKTEKHVDVIDPYGNGRYGGVGWLAQPRDETGTGRAGDEGVVVTVAGEELGDIVHRSTEQY